MRISPDRATFAIFIAVLKSVSECRLGKIVTHTEYILFLNFKYSIPAAALIRRALAALDRPAIVIFYCAFYEERKSRVGRVKSERGSEEEKATGT